MLSHAAQKIIDEARGRIVSRENPNLADLPEKFADWFDVQRQAIYDVVDAYRDGVGVVVLEGPPGTGKTVIAETIRRLLQVEKSLYLCTTKSLQDQFSADFPYAKVIKGRGNYPTECYPEKFGSDWTSLTCADCTKTKAKPHCKWCISPMSCPYERAKNVAIRSKLAVANTSYFLTEANGVGRFSNWPFVIVDECDQLATELMRHVTLQISEKKMEKYGIKAPGKVTVESSWLDWARATAPILQEALEKVSHVQSSVAGVRERKWLESCYGGVCELGKGLAEGIEEENGAGWIYTGTRERIEFKPVVVSGLGKKWVWKHSPRWLLMSGTVISAELRLAELGYEGEWRYVAIPSTFDRDKRKVVIRPVVEMTWKNQQESRGPLLVAIRRIVRDHPNERILIHSVSYDLTHFIQQGLSDLSRTVISYSRAGERDRALQEYLRTEGSILVAPSVDRGIDLPGEACRVQVIAKVPYPNLGDKQIAARVYGGGRQGQNWFNMETVSTIVQMTGRAVRSREDWAVCYVLDKQFLSLWSKARGLFPAYWRDGLVWE